MVNRKNKFRRSIFFKAMTSIVLATSLPILGLWYFSSYQFQKDLDIKVNSHFENIAEQLAGKIDSWKDMNVRLLKQVGQLDAITSGEAHQQGPVLKSIVNNYEWVYLAYTVGVDGYMAGRSDFKNRPVYNDDGSKAHYRGDREYHKQIMGGNNFSEELLINRTHGKPAFIMCTKNKSSENNRLQGSLCLAMTVAAVSDEVTNVSVGHTGYAILLDGSNRVIAHGDTGVHNKDLQDMSDSPLIKESVKGKPYIFFDANGVKKIAYQKVTLEGWKLFIEQEYDDAFSPLDDSTRNALVFFIVTILISMFIAFLMARRLAHPIKMITRMANSVSRGEYHNKLDDNDFSNDEIGDLQEAVERMRKTIQMAMSRLKNS
jgi:methyl-accepting chemotaxis protein